MGAARGHRHSLAAERPCLAALPQQGPISILTNRFQTKENPISQHSLMINFIKTTKREPLPLLPVAKAEVETETPKELSKRATQVPLVWVERGFFSTSTKITLINFPKVAF